MSDVLAIDVGGSHVKARIASSDEKRRFISGSKLTPEQMVEALAPLVQDWQFDRISIGIPAPICKNTPSINPVNLGPGWTGFDFSSAFGKPTRVVNDAAMQAIGSYEGGSMLFLGLGTGLGSCLIDSHVVHPTEIAHMPWKDGKTFEQLVGEASMEAVGKKAWRKLVVEMTHVLFEGLLPDYIVLGGGNIKKFKDDDPIPDFCRRGENTNAFLGGFRMWDDLWAKSFAD